MIKSIAQLAALAIVGTTLVFNISVSAANDQYELKQRIVPLECTRNEVINGVTTVTYLTPKECDDILNPPDENEGEKPAEEKPVNEKPLPIPKAPNTGQGQFMITGVLLIVGMLLFVRFKKPRKR